MRSHVIVRERESGSEIPALSHVTINACSDCLGWTGLRFEVGSNLGCDLDDVTVDGHYLVFNLGPSPLHFQSRNDGEWVSGCQPPHSFWIIPEGRPFSIRHHEQNDWASVLIDGPFLDSVVGHHCELKAAKGANDPLLAHLMLALVERLKYSKVAFEEMDRHLMHAFILALAKRHGVRAAELPIRGGIAPHQLKSLFLWLEQNLSGPLTIDSMASQVGLSVAHFSREFKRSTQVTPWAYVVQSRLDRAWKLLKAGETIPSTASQCGFSDQSHLSRLFKQRFGVQPRILAKSTPANDLVSKRWPLTD